ncbi:hypothetical protein BC938DRAFT_471942 [Jimgerdemannia flammicorona]|uniref:Uncharacterized protein n=1 Tax=Jimgerdemannia flammicorona TaxID=994334 RepID=A0A433Q755_9FUNG|nr:hypothetical protein BC938DRAFT_471942 [Jimgerdemannia flammicorona]
MKFTAVATLLASIATIASAQSSSASDAVSASIVASSSPAVSSPAVSSPAVSPAVSSPAVSGSTAAVASPSNTVASPAPSQTWVATGPIAPPADLPPQTWTILQESDQKRASVCDTQKSYCTNNCGGPGKDPKNFCNVTSMAWGCGCSVSSQSFTHVFPFSIDINPSPHPQTKAPDINYYSWPIVQEECTGRSQACQMSCLVPKGVPDVGKCQIACNQYYQCGSANAPKSYLETNSPTDTPLYFAPVVSNTSNTSTTNTTTNTSTTTKTGNAIGKNVAEMLGSVAIALLVAAGVVMI